MPGTTGRSWWAALAAGVAVLAVVGAAVLLGSDDTRKAAAPAPPATAEPDGPQRPPSASSPPQARLPGLLTVQSFEVLPPDGLRVRYANGVPECYGTLGRVEVVETASRVVLRLHRDPPKEPATGPCPEMAVVEQTAVRLSRPLGDRQVFDGSSRRPVAGDLTVGRGPR